jgi:uncharacterized protein with FMN-binding domain
MKLVLKIVLCVFLIFVLIGGAGMFYLTRGLEAGKDVSIKAVNLSGLKDGDYNGKYTSGRWSNEVKVTVKDGKITDIVVVKDVTFPKPEWTKELFDRIIHKQSSDVDVVSGATITSKAYIKAIEDALSNNVVKK